MLGTSSPYSSEIFYEDYKLLLFFLDNFNLQDFEEELSFEDDEL